MKNIRFRNRKSGLIVLHLLYIVQLVDVCSLLPLKPLNQNEQIEHTTTNRIIVSSSFEQLCGLAFFIYSKSHTSSHPTWTRTGLRDVKRAPSPLRILLITVSVSTGQSSTQIMTYNMRLILHYTECNNTWKRHNERVLYCYWLYDLLEKLLLQTS